MEIKDMNLYQRLAQLQWGAIKIAKDGKNNFAGWNYKTLTGIKRAIMEKMLELNLTVSPTNEHLTPEQMNMHVEDIEYINAKNQKKIVSKVVYLQEFRLTNADKPSDYLTFYFPQVGTNNDGVDKANGASVTYTTKYLLNMLGIIPDEDLDPDTDNTIESEPKRKPSKEPSKLTNDMIAVLEAIKSPTVPDEVKEAVKERLNVFTNGDHSQSALINGVQNDDSRMQELLKIIGENK